MRISSLCCGRADVRLDGLTDGLNVLYGSPNSVKADLRHDVYTVLFGPPTGRETRSAGGWIEFSDGGRPVKVSRHRKGGSFGSLHVENGSDSNVNRWLSDLTREQFNAFFSVHFGDARTIGWLVKAADQLGEQTEQKIDERFLAEVESRVEDELRHSTASHRLVDLEGRRQQLLAEIEAFEEWRLHDQHVDETEIAHVEHRIASVEHAIRVRTNEREDLDRAIAELDPPFYDTYQSTYPAYRTGYEAESIRALDEQIARLRRLEHDFNIRLEDARDEIDSRYSVSFHSPRVVLRRLESQIVDIEDELAREYPYYDSYRAHSRGRVESMLTDVRNGLYELCDELGRAENYDRRDSLATEVWRMEGFRTELQRQTERLVADRNALVDEMVRLDERFAWRYRTDSFHAANIDCQCEYHREWSLNRRAGLRGECSCERCRFTRESQLAAYWRAEDELKSSRRDVVQCLAALHDELAEWQERLRYLVDHARPAYRGPSIEELHRELAHVQSQIEATHRHEYERVGARRVLNVIRSMRNHQPANRVFEEASTLLARLTHNSLQDIDFHTADATLWVGDSSGKRFNYDQLSLAARDQVKLALALAGAAECDRRGVSAPIMLEDAFVHIEGEQARTAMKCIRDYCGSGRQALLLTTLGRVAGEARDLGVPVRSLQYGEYEYYVHGTGYRPIARAVNDSADRYRRRRDRTRVRNMNHFDDLNYDSAYDRPIDSWPWREIHNAHRPTTVVNKSWQGRRIDRPISIYAEPVGEKPADYNDRHLRASDRITDAPFLEFVVARKLESIGVETVGDLMNADANELSDRLPAEWGPSSRIRNWQSQARIMCAIPGIRSYDSRILVASGIRSPRQIHEMDPAELYRRVEEFINTPEGQRLSNSGSDQEIARFARWREAARQTTRSQRTNRESSRSSERNSSRDSNRSSNRRSRSSQHSSHSESSTSRERSRNRRERREKRERERTSRRKRSQRSREQREYETRLHTQREETDSGPRYYLSRSDDIERAPSIGPRTAERFYKVGVRTVDDLLNCNPQAIGDRINVRHITAEKIRDWQQQASLVCRVPFLRGHDAQFMVACDVNSVDELSSISASELFGRVDPFCDTKPGQRILRNGKRPTLEEVNDWITWGRSARSLSAA